MARKRQLPPGLTPRLLSDVDAGLYCGIAAERFTVTIGADVKPIELEGLNRWDIKAIDRWIDEQSGLTHAADNRTLRERLNGGNQGARR
jgi:hypothetical protein